MAVNINIPSQVKTYANLAAFPATGAVKTIYIAEDTNKTYRWTGTAYVEISASAAMTWGQIGGTLSNQTDLQNALNAKQDSLGFTAVPTTRTLTINGVTQDLSADRTYTIATGLTVGTTPIASGTVGRVLFQGTGNVVSESANLFWDDTNGRLGIGGSPSVYNLDVKGIGIVRGGAFDLQNTTGDVGLSFYPNAANMGIIYSDVLRLRRISNSTVFLQGFASGNVGINTTTDAGFRLDVNGTARVQGALNVTTSVTANTASSGTGYEGYKIQDGANARFVAERLVTNFLGIGHNSTAGRWDDVILGAAQRLYFYTGASERARFAATTGNLLINTTTDAGYKLDVNGTARIGNTDGIKFTPGNNSSITFMQAVDRISLTRLNSDKLQITAAGTNTIIGNGISTNASAHTWLLEGEITSAVTMDTTKYVKVFINGVAYKLAVCI